MNLAAFEANIDETQLRHRSKILHKVRIERVAFDASNPEHRVAYGVFRRTGRWTMQFQPEFPLTVTQTIDRALINRALAGDVAAIEEAAGAVKAPEIKLPPQPRPRVGDAQFFGSVARAP